MAGLNGLHRYFTSGTANSDTATQPSGSLVLQSASGLTPVSTVNIAQALVNADTLAQKSKKRKKTNSVPANIKLKIARYAVEEGTINSAVEKFSKEYPQFSLQRRTVNNWALVLKKAISLGSPLSEIIFANKDGRPSFLDSFLITRINDLIVGSREAGGVISRRNVINIGRAVVLTTKPELLEETGGSLKLTENWARGILRSLNYVKRRGTTSKRKISVMLYEEVKFRFQSDISILVRQYNIPPSLVLNFDQTPLSYVSLEKYTFDTRGSSSVPIANADDKRAITATFGVNAEGEFLDIQLIYKGKTTRCLPKFKFPNGFDVLFNEKHWANEATALSFLEKIIIPFVTEEKLKLGLPVTQKSLLLFDVFRAHLTPKVKQYMSDNHLVYTCIPANLTNLFQPLDISVNKVAKGIIRSKYGDYYTDAVRSQLLKGTAPTDIVVDTKISTLRPLHAQWIVDLFKEMQEKQELIVKGFRKAGIIDALSMDYLFEDDPFLEDDEDM